MLAAVGTIYRRKKRQRNLSMRIIENKNLMLVQRNKKDDESMDEKIK